MAVPQIRDEAGQWWPANHDQARSITLYLAQCKGGTFRTTTHMMTANHITKFDGSGQQHVILGWKVDRYYSPFPRPETLKTNPVRKHNDETVDRIIEAIKSLMDAGRDCVTFSYHFSKLIIVQLEMQGYKVDDSYNHGWGTSISWQ